MYRFEPLLDAAGQPVVRPPKKGEYYLCPYDTGAVLAHFDFTDAVPIYVRVPHTDTACEVAFARMYATFENLWTDKDAPFAIDYTHLCARFRDGERTPALVAEMTDLTNRMKGSA